MPRPAADRQGVPVPFTLAHPAAVLPLLRRPLVPAALVAGSLSPDVPYFLPLPRSAGSWYEPFVNATTTHAWPGALTVAVPTAGLLLAAWWVVRPPLRALATAGDPRVAPPEGGWRTAWWVVVSLVLGVATHVAWDSFTHGEGAVVQHVAWLREPVVGGVSGGRLLQHLSTALGLAVLAWWAGRRLAARHAAGWRVVVDRRRVLVAVGLLVAAVAGAVAGVLRADGAGPEALLSGAAKVGGTALAGAGLLAAGLWWVVRLGRGAARPGS